MMQVFRVERRDGGLAHLVMDHPARKLNVLDGDAVASLEAALTDLESAPPQGVLVRSAKPGSFIAGGQGDRLSHVISRFGGGEGDGAIRVNALRRDIGRREVRHDEESRGPVVAGSGIARRDLHLPPFR